MAAQRPPAAIPYILVDCYHVEIVIDSHRRIAKNPIIRTSIIFYGIIIDPKTSIPGHHIRILLCMHCVEGVDGCRGNDGDTGR